jgi:hypothetical protein
VATRTEFIAQARRYTGVQHRHQGRARLGGKDQAVDCVGLLVCVFEDLGIQDRNGKRVLRADTFNYGRHPTRDDAHEELKRRLLLKAEAPKIAILPAPGDVISIRVRYREAEPGVTCHVAIVTQLPHNRLGIIHALGSVGRVTEHELTPKWIRRIEGIFTVPELAD